MPPCTVCPDAHRLRDLLDGSLPDEEQAALTCHLDGCTVCQKTLETLAAGPAPWAVTSAWHLHEPIELGGALHRAMAELRGDDPAIWEDDPACADDGPLPFLDPTDRPDLLGRFGPYDVVEVIGRGGMGIVLKALDPTLGRVVAVKVLAPQLAACPTARRRFAREARAAAAVNHDHVVPIFAVDSAAGLPYLVMPYVPGGSLQQLLDRGVRVPLPEVLRIGLETAAGLAAAHARGLVHRDVKPANILLEEGGRVRLTDFGLARLRDDASMTLSHVLVGTPQYMAPEQARGEPVDHRADLFSLGSVLYALCTGRPPFQASTTLAVLRRVSDDTPTPVQELNPLVPDWLVEIMNRLHTKDPARRFPSAAELSRLLARHLAHPPDTRQGPPRPADGPRTPRRPRHLTWLALPALLLLAFLLTETFGLTHVGDWAATVLRVRTPEGTLVIEVNDPSVHVTVDGSEVSISGAGLAELRLRVGAHRVQATQGGAPVHDSSVQITRDEKEVVKIRLERPAPAQVHVHPNAALNDARIREIHVIADPGSCVACHGPSRNEPLTIKQHTGAVRCLSFSPDGKVLATGGDDGAAYLLDSASGRIRAALKGHTGRLVSLAFFVANARADNVKYVIAPDLPVTTEGGILKLATAGAGTPLLLATVSDDGTIKLWDVTVGREVANLKLPAPVQAGALLPGGKALVTVGRTVGDKDLRLWSVSTGKQLGTRLPLGDTVSVFVVSPDARRLATAGQDASVRVYDVGTGRQLTALMTGNNPVNEVTFSPDGRRLASVGGDQAIRLWDAATGKELTRVLSQGKVYSLAFTPDGKTLVAADREQASSVIRILDVATGKWVAELRGQTGTVTCLAFSPDGKRLASASTDGTVRIWTLAPGGPIPAAPQPLQQGQLHGYHPALPGSPPARADSAPDTEKLRSLLKDLERERLQAQQLAEAARQAEERARAEAARSRAAADYARARERAVSEKARQILSLPPSTPPGPSTAPVTPESPGSGPNGAGGGPGGGSRSPSGAGPGTRDSR